MGETANYEEMSGAVTASRDLASRRGRRVKCQM